MIGLGFLILFIGVVFVGYGNQLNNDIETQMDSLFEKGTTNTGDNYIVIGIFIGIIGLILLIYGIFRAKNKNDSLSENNQVINVSTHQFENCIKCSYCGSLNLGDSKFCAACGEEIKIMNCNNCNTLLLPEQNFCPNCGQKIEKDLKCKVCDAKLSPENKFCPKCGEKI